MVQVQNGDEQALALLMERWRKPLYSFLHHRVGDAADDLFQESFLRLVRARQRYDPSRRFSTWLFQISNNLCRDRWRRLSARDRAHEAFRNELLATQGEGGGGGEMRSDESAVLRAQLFALPERLREVLVLRYFFDQSEAEIARVLDIPRGTVKSRAHAALKALRAALAGQQREAVE